jgi:hypothetical protein
MLLTTLMYSAELAFVEDAVALLKTTEDDDAERARLVARTIAVLDAAEARRRV